MKSLALNEHSDRFQSGAAKYAEYLETAEGRLRLDLAFSNLMDFLPDRKPAQTVRALDIGSGTGTTGVRLAKLGFAVAMLDSAPAMLDMARRAAQNAGVTELVELQSGDAGQVGELFEPKSFDLIVCHNVLEYVEHPAETLRSAAGLLKDSAAVFSIVVRNQIGEVLKAAIKSGNLAEAEENLTAERGTESLYGGTVLLLSAETLWQMLRDASLEVIANRGIRVVSDYLPEKVSLSRDYQRILDLELKLGRRPEFAAIARYMQCLVRCASREDKA